MIAQVRRDRLRRPHDLIELRLRQRQRHHWNITTSSTITMAIATSRATVPVNTAARQLIAANYLRRV